MMNRDKIKNIILEFEELRSSKKIDDLILITTDKIENLLKEEIKENNLKISELEEVVKQYQNIHGQLEFMLRKKLEDNK